MSPRIDSIIGGFFGPIGTVVANNTASLHLDKWEENIPPLPHNDALGQGLTFSDPTDGDRVWFKGTWWIAGNLKIDDGSAWPSAGTRRQYGVAFWNWVDERWEGVLLVAATYGGVGMCLYVWNGLLYASQQGAAGGGNTYIVKTIDFAADTQTPTVADIAGTGWVAAVGANAQCHDMLAFDDGDGEKLYFVGEGYTVGGANQYLKRYDGSAWSDIGGPTTTAGKYLKSLCAYDFGDGGGEKIVVCGLFTTISGDATYGNIAARSLAGGWEHVGAAGIACTGGNYVSSVCGFNKRLWAGRGHASVSGSSNPSPLVCWPQGNSPAWQDAIDVLRNLDYNSTGGALEDLWLQTGSSDSDRTRGPVNSLRVYGGKLHVGGIFQRRGLRRGRIRSGALTYEDFNDNIIFRSLPFLTGDIRSLCAFDGGVVVAGDIGSAGVRNVAVYFDVATHDSPGTFDTLGGGVNGPVYAAAVFNGDLYVVGDFTEAGGVAVKGIAHWDGAAWGPVVNISDYGTAKLLCVFDGYLIVAGDFSAVDGLVSRKLVCAINTSHVTTAIFDDINGVGDEAEIRALYTNIAGTFLYMGGNIDDIDDGGGFETMNHIARCPAGTTWNWEPLNDNDASTTPGINPSSGSVYSIGEYAGDILVGCTPLAKGGASSSTKPLWKWTPGTPGVWAVMETTLRGKVEPVNAITSNGLTGASSVAWVTFSGVKTDESTTFDPLNRVREFANGGNRWLGLGPDATPTYGQDFDVQPSALCYASAGAGESRLYIAGPVRSVGNATTETSAPAMGIIAITTDDYIVDVAGGLGATRYFGFDAGTSPVRRIRQSITTDFGTEDATTIEKQTINIAGTTTAGTLRVKVTKPNGERLFTETAAWSGTFATVISNLNAALETLLGNERCIASGSEWTAIVLTFSGASFREYTQPLVEVDISALTGATSVTVTRTQRIGCARLGVVGTFGTQNYAYSQHLVGIDQHGAIVPIGLCNGRYGATTGAVDVKAVPVAEWPDEWLDPDYSDLANDCGATLDPLNSPLPFVFLIAGPTESCNPAVADIDLGTVKEIIYAATGIHVHDGRRYFRDVGVGLADPTGDTISSVECYDNKLVAASSANPPKWLNYGTSPPSWEYLHAEGTNGGIPEGSSGDHPYITRWNGKLWYAANCKVNPSATIYPGAHWNGTTFVGFAPVGFTSAIASVYLKHFLVANLGAGEKFYACGTADTYNTCPVIVTTDGTTWSAVGSSTLRGNCYGLSAIEKKTGVQGFLVAVGDLEVNDGGWAATQVAYFDGTNWHGLGAWSGTGLIEFGAVTCGDFSGRWDAETLHRAIVVNDFTEIADTPALIGGVTAQFADGMAQVRDPDGAGGFEPFKGRSGVAGVGVCCASGGKILYPKTADSA